MSDFDFNIDSMKTPRSRQDDMAEEAFDSLSETLGEREPGAAPLPGASPPGFSGNPAADIQRVLADVLPMSIEYRHRGKNVVFTDLPDIHRLRERSLGKISRYIQSPALAILDSHNGKLMTLLRVLGGRLPVLFDRLTPLLETLDDRARAVGSMMADPSLSDTLREYYYRVLVEEHSDVTRSGKLNGEEIFLYKLRQHIAELSEQMMGVFELIDTVESHATHFQPWKKWEARRRAELNNEHTVAGNEKNARTRLSRLRDCSTSGAKEKTQLMWQDADMSSYLKINNRLNLKTWEEREIRQKLVLALLTGAAALKTSLRLTRASSYRLVEHYYGNKKASSEAAPGKGTTAEQALELSRAMHAVSVRLERLVGVLADGKEALPPDTITREDKCDESTMHAATNFVEKRVRETAADPLPSFARRTARAFTGAVNKGVYQWRKFNDVDETDRAGVTAIAGPSGIDIALFGIDTVKRPTEAQEIAIRKVGVLLSDRLQRQVRALTHIELDVQWLHLALEQKAATDSEQKHKFSTSLDKSHSMASAAWQANIDRARARLLDTVSRMGGLADEDEKLSFRHELRNLLVTHPEDSVMLERVREFYDFTELCIDRMAKVEEACIGLVDEIIPAPGMRRKDFKVSLITWRATLKQCEDDLDAGLKLYTGRSDNRFSRDSMLAKGLAERFKDSKRVCLAGVDKARRATTGEQYDTLVINAVLASPLFAGVGKGEQEIFAQRLRIEMKHATSGDIIYPPTMAGMVAGMKGMDAALRGSVKSALMRKGPLRVIRGAALVPELIALPAQMAVRAAIRGAVTGATYAYVRSAGEKGIRLGQGGVGRARQVYGGQLLKTALVKTFVSSVPMLSLLAGLRAIQLELDEGRNVVDITEDILRGGIRDIPWQGMDVFRRNLMNAWREGQEGKRDATLELLVNKLSCEVNVMPDIPTGPSASNVLSLIAAGDDVELAKLAKRLQSVPGGHQIRMQWVEIPESSHYDLRTRTIMLNVWASDEEILHEIAHALSAHQLRAGRDNPDTPLGATVLELDELREAALKAYQNTGGRDKETLYYLGNLDEFVAGLYSGDGEFRRFLDSIHVNERSLLAQAVVLLCLVLGLDTERDSALTHAMGLSETIMRMPRTEREKGVGPDFSTHHRVAGCVLTHCQTMGPQHSSPHGLHRPLSAVALLIERALVQLKCSKKIGRNYSDCLLP